MVVNLIPVGKLSGWATQSCLLGDVGVLDLGRNCQSRRRAAVQILAVVTKVLYCFPV